MDTFTATIPQCLYRFIPIIHLGFLFRARLKPSSEQLLCLPWLSLHLLVQELGKDFKPNIFSFTITLSVKFLLSY